MANVNQEIEEKIEMQESLTNAAHTNVVFDTISNMSDAEIQQHTDSRGFNLLMLASEAGHIQAVQNLINRGEEVNCEVDENTAASLAFSNGHHEVVLMLLKNNSKFPHNFAIESASDELKAFLELSADMHARVSEINEDDLNSFEEVQKYLKENFESNSTLRYFYDLRNFSLLKTSILNRKFKCYEFLINQSIFLAPDEEISDIVEPLPNSQRKKLRELNLKISPNLFDPKMMILMQNCKLGPDTPKYRHGEFMLKIRNAFEILFEIPLIVIVLKIVAATRNFKIIFDFSRDYVNFLDPTAEPFMNGLFYLNGKIYVAAKDMLDPNKSINTIGVIAHELCHYAMYILYDNLAKPYKEKNYKKIVEFMEICIETRQEKDFDEIVESVYDCYDEEMHHAELIVRVPQMLAIYHDKEEILESKRENFKLLFDFYEQTCVADMKNELPKIEEKFDPFLKAERKLKKQRKIIFFSIFLIIFVMSFGIWGIFLLYEARVSWSTLSLKNQMKVKQSNINYHGVEVKFEELFANDSSIYQALSSKQINQALEGKTSDLSATINTFYEPQIFLVWSNMTENLKRKILNSKVDFQGQNVSLNKIINDTSALNLLTADEVKHVLKNEKFKISLKVESNVKFFLERFFVEEKVSINKKVYFDGKVNVKNENVTSIKETRNQVEFKKNKIFLLSSVAGEGKSTTFRHFASKLKKKFPTKWIQFVDLKMYSKIYKNNENLNFSNLEDVRHFLSATLINSTKFDAEIFNQVFNRADVVFLFDGVDEILPLYKSFMLNLTTCLKDLTDNFQFLSTRPLHSKELREKLSVKAHKMIPLGEKEILEFIVKFIGTENLNFDAEEFWNIFQQNATKIDHEVLRKISKVKKVLENLKSSQSDAITNPLLIEIIVEAAEEETKENLSSNLYELYKYFIHKKLKIIHRKGDIVEKETDEIIWKSLVNLNQLHQAYAFQLIFGNAEDLNISSLKIMEMIKKVKIEEISHFGILQVFSENDFAFSHRTFAEYLIAQYLIDNFGENAKVEDELKIKIFCTVMLERNFDFIRKFLLDFLQLNQKLLGIFQILQDFYGKIRNVKKVTKNEKLLEYFSDKGFIFHFTRFYNTSTVNFEEKFYEWTNEELKDISQYWEEINDILGKEILKISLDDVSNKNLLSNFVNFGSTESFEEFVLKTNKTLNREEIFELFLKNKNEFAETLLMTAAKKRNSNFLTILINFTRKTFQQNQVEIILTGKNLKSHSVFYNSLFNDDIFSFLAVKNFYENFFVSKIQEVIKENFDEGLHEVAKFASLETIHELLKFLEEKFAINLKDLREILLISNAKGETIFKTLKGDEKIKERLEIFMNLLKFTLKNESEEKTKNILENLNQKSDFQNKLESLEKFEGGEFFPFIELSKKIQSKVEEKLFKSLLMRKNKNVLNSFLGKDHTEQYYKLLQNKLNKFEIIEILLQRDDSNRTQLMNAVTFFDYKNVQKFWKFIEYNLDIDQQKILLNIKDKNFWNCLQHSALNQDSSSFLFVKSLYEKVFALPMISEILITFDQNQLFFVHDVIKSASTQTVTEVSKLIKKYLDKDTISKLLSHRNFDGDTIFSKLKLGEEEEEQVQEKKENEEDDDDVDDYVIEEEGEDDNFSSNASHLNEETLDTRRKIFIKLLRESFEANQQKEFKLHFKLLEFKSKFSKIFNQNLGVDKLETFRDDSWIFTNFYFLSVNLDKIVKTFGRSTLIKILLRQNEKGENLLHDILRYKENENFIEPFLKIMEQNLNLNKTFALLIEENGDGKTPIGMAASFKTEIVLKLFLNFIEKNYEEFQIKSILLKEDRNFKTLLHFSLKNEDLNSFLTTKEFYQKYLLPAEIQQMILKLNKNSLPMNLQIFKGLQDENAEGFSLFIANAFKDEKLKLRTFLDFRDVKGETIFIALEDYSVLKFIENILKSTFDEIQDKEYEKFHEFLIFKSKLARLIQSKDNLDLHDLRSENWIYSNFFVLIKNFKNIKEILDQENFVKLLNSKNEQNRTLLHELFSFDENQSFVEEFLKKIDESLSANEIIKLLFARDDSNETPFMISSFRSNENSLKIFWNFCEKFLRKESQKLLLKDHFYYSTALHRSTWNKNLSSFMFVRDVYEKNFNAEEIQDIILLIESNDLPHVSGVIENASLKTTQEIQKYYRNLFKDKRKKLRNFLSHRALNGDTIFSRYDDLYESKVKFKSEVFKKLLRFTFNENQEEEFRIFFEIVSTKSTFARLLEFKKNIELEDIKNVRNEAWTFTNFYLLNENLQIIQNSSDERLFKSFLKSKNEDGETLLHELFDLNENQNFTQIFLKKNLEILSKTEVFDLFCVKTNDYKNTALMNAFWKRNEKDIKIILNLLEENFDEGENKKLLLDESKYFNTPLQHLTWNKDPNSFLLAKNFYQKNLATSKIKEILLKIHLDSFLPFTENLIAESSFETAIEVKIFFEDIFKTEKIKLRRLLSYRDSYGNSCYSRYKDQTDYQETFNVFVDLLRWTFQENQENEFKLYFENLKITNEDE